MSSPAASIRPLVAGNWKMNGLSMQLAEVRAIRTALEDGRIPHSLDVMICPPGTLISRLAQVAEGSRLAIGGQDCHWLPSGAHTGDISAEMLRDAGATAVIVGHSERRADHGELDTIVKAKAEAAHRAGMAAIVCIGETAGQRRAGLTLDVVARQLARSAPDAATAGDTIIAYEPVWAIGTGVTPTAEEVAEVHAFIRTALIDQFAAQGRHMRILYGGSVKPSNAGDLMAIPNVNGALVGGASLKAVDLLGIVGGFRS
jgi:triosephosphate isomerase